jgi:ribulose-5-phosphate 4-epimerase/fuculose-1-phosphate aldolase
MSFFISCRIVLYSSIILAMAWGSASAQAPASSNANPPDTVAELVAANHVLAKLKLVDAFGHITMRDPTNPQRFFMARGVPPVDVTEKDILVLDLDSNVIDKKAGSAPLEKFIHGEIYKARPDVNSIVHSHSPTVIPFSVSKTPLRPIAHTGAFLLPAVPVYEQRTTAGGASNMMISDQKLGKALADTLGQNTVALLRGHGSVVVAPKVGLAVYRTYFTEVSAQLLLQARQLDGPLTYIYPDEAALANDLRNTGYTRQWDLWKKEMGN